jgi:hypothetical protein
MKWKIFLLLMGWSFFGGSENVLLAKSQVLDSHYIDCQERALRLLTANGDDRKIFFSRCSDTFSSKLCDRYHGYPSVLSVLELTYKYLSVGQDDEQLETKNSILQNGEQLANAVLELLLVKDEALPRGFLAD